jgi:hypothetical protein
MNAAAFSLRRWVPGNRAAMFVAVFLQALKDENTRRRLFRQFSAKLHNKKVIQC